MTLTLKLYKSAGVPVTAAVHRTLLAANRARDNRDWGAAVAGYRAALQRDPALVHIWIQLGHARKEMHDYAEAEAAYHEAARLKPEAAEPHLHLGHLKKRQGDGAGASRCYVRAARLEPNHPDVLGELHGVAAGGLDISPEELLSILQPLMDDPDGWRPETSLRDTADEAQAGVRDLLAALKQDGLDLDPGTLEKLAAVSDLLEAVGRDVAGKAARPETGPALVFDVSDLISYFRNARLPTGIQRVQIETISSALQAGGGRTIKVCCFLEKRDEWLEIPAAAFMALCRLSLSDGDRTAPEWTLAIRRLQVLLNMAEAMVFPTGAYLINLGTSWWLQNYFLFVRKAKAEHAIRYVPFVHDFIPVMASEHCTRELTQDFISWAIGAFEHADFFLVNSNATKRDLLAVGELLDHPVEAERIGVVRLDADFRKPVRAQLPASALAEWGLARAPFVLFVSTIESRKNHLCAFEAWTQMIRTHGPRKVPKLVCVGNRGWLNDAVYAQLDTNRALRDQVVMLSGLSDAELALLYQSCLFTLYPSRYEGWGLPVTESLCYGKVPLISDASSLPEAGGQFAVYFESGSASRLAKAAERLIFDAERRADRERLIAEQFRPRTWRDIAGQMADQVSAWAAQPRPTISPVPQARFGAYYPIVRNYETRLWRGFRSAEVFRAGAGWWGPDDWGCWTKAQGGRLEIGLPQGHGPVRAFLRLHGLPDRASAYRLRIGSSAVVEGALNAGEFKWIPVDIPAAEDDDPVLHIRLDGSETLDLATVTQGLDPRVVGVGLAGFFLCEADDAATRATFLEAIALGALHDLVFNREPTAPLEPGDAAPDAEIVAWPGPQASLAARG
jgi:glycosyltransferase involved in cell wall biosynthesis